MFILCEQQEIYKGGLKGPLNLYMSWSAVCYTKTFDKTRRWQTLWLRLYRAVNLTARVSELSIDGGEMSKIDSFSGHNLFWYSVNLSLWWGCTIRCGVPEGFGFKPKRCWSSWSLRESISERSKGLVHWVGGYTKPFMHYCSIRWAPKNTLWLIMSNILLQVTFVKSNCFITSNQKWSEFQQQVKPMSVGTN